MSDALRNFLQERDPYGHAEDILVSQRDLEHLLGGHEDELSRKHELELAALEDELSDAGDAECLEEHCEGHDFRCLSCGDSI